MASEAALDVGNECIAFHRSGRACDADHNFRSVAVVGTSLIVPKLPEFGIAEVYVS